MPGTRLPRSVPCPTEAQSEAGHRGGGGQPAAAHAPALTPLAGHRGRRGSSMPVAMRGVSITRKKRVRREREKKGVGPWRRRRPPMMHGAARRADAPNNTGRRAGWCRRSREPPCPEAAAGVRGAAKRGGPRLAAHTSGSRAAVADGADGGGAGDARHGHHALAGIGPRRGRRAPSAPRRGSRRSAADGLGGQALRERWCVRAALRPLHALSM